MNEPDDGSGPPRHHSVAVRVRRTIVEEVHVRVPVTEAVVTDDHLDGAKVFAVALELATSTNHRWRLDGEAVLEVHPNQTPPDLDR